MKVASNGTLLLTLALSAGLAFLFTLALYTGNPLNRVGYGVFVSVAPAVCAFVLLKLTKRSSWQRAAVVYLVLFVAVVIIQMLGR